MAWTLYLPTTWGKERKLTYQGKGEYKDLKIRRTSPFLFDDSAKCNVIVYFKNGTKKKMLAEAHQQTTEEERSELGTYAILGHIRALRRALKKFNIEQFREGNFTLYEDGTLWNYIKRGIKNKQEK